MALGKLHQLQLTIRNAVIEPPSTTSSSSPDIYVELTIDGRKDKKTATIPGTYFPIWDEHLDILVKPKTILTFQVLSRLRFRTDSILANSTLKLGQVLSENNGKLHNTDKTLDLMEIKGTCRKIGELFVVLSGMSIEIPLDQQQQQQQLMLASELPALGSELGQISANYNYMNTQGLITNIHRTYPPYLHLPPPPPPYDPASPSPPPSPPPPLLMTFEDQPSHPTLATDESFQLLFVDDFTSTAASSVPVIDELGHTDPDVVELGHTDPDVGELGCTDPDVGELGHADPDLSLPRDSAVTACSSSVFDDFGFSFLDTMHLQTTFQINQNCTTSSLLQQPSSSHHPPISLITFDDDDKDVQPSSDAIPSSSSSRPFLLLDIDGQGTSLNDESVDDNEDGAVEQTDNEMNRIDREENLFYTPSSLSASSSGVTFATSNPSQGQSSMRYEDDYDDRSSIPRQGSSSSSSSPSFPRSSQTTTDDQNLMNRIHSFELHRNNLDSWLMEIASRFLPSHFFGGTDVEGGGGGGGRGGGGGGGNGALPEGWERLLNNRGITYFYNRITSVTTYEDPRIHSLLREDPLPVGWEMRITDGGVVYFINHVTHQHSYKDPRGKDLKCSVGPFGIHMQQERSFSWKLAQFREICLSEAVEGHVKIHVSRENVFLDSYNQICRIPAPDLRKRLYVVFSREDGLDYGGVAREWFLLLSLEFLHPILGLFQYVSDRNYMLQISPASAFVDQNYLSYFRFIGRFVALALYHGMFIGSSFCLAFYKKMLNRNLTLNDLESVDCQVYNSLKWIRDTDLNETSMPDLYFVADFEILGKIEHYELKPGGSNISVTEENKKEYIILMIDWMFTRGIEKQTKEFLRGFEEIFPLKWLQNFDEKELELMLCGMQEIDVNDWEKNTVYKNYRKSNKQIEWFWKFVRELTHEERMRLLQFVTGTCRLPIGGFSQLNGSNGLQKFCIEKVGKDGSLPRSHTCFNRLDLPPYKSYERLTEKLKYAIKETEGFGLE